MKAECHAAECMIVSFYIESSLGRGTVFDARVQTLRLEDFDVLDTAVLVSCLVPGSHGATLTRAAEEALWVGRLHGSG